MAAGKRNLAEGPALRPFGQWLSLQPELLWAYEGPVNPRMRHHLAVRTQRVSAWLILRGRVRLVSDDVTLRVPAGEWVFFTGSFQKHDFSRDARLLSLSLRVPEGGAEAWRHEPFTLAAADHPRLERVARRLIDSIAAHGPEVSSHLHGQPLPFEDFLRVSGLGLLWAAEYMALRAKMAGEVRPARRQDPRVAQAIRRFMAAPLRDGFSEAKLAGEAGVSAGHLERLFQREVGATPRQLWERQRQDEAGRRVRHSDAPFKQLAYELGFGSQSHFSHWYRRTFGQSPRAHRKEART